ncbi:nucleotidyltransferase domain-containing protein [Actinoplanes sp. NPDC049596]|uniref:nucleotidyltransferase domain-containing protein n=1 Tax=unclassified Actinoplanes TaxID=2626549 RepID=UPI003416D340
MTQVLAGLMDEVRDDPAVVGLVLTGSHARGLATARSDVDAYVVTQGPVGWQPVSPAPRWDLTVLSVDELADVSDTGRRYAYRGARVLLDRLDGRVAELVRRQATLSTEDADAIARAQLGRYAGFVRRAVAHRRDGRAEVARLEEMEAAGVLLTALFAVFGRVRPYNKYLRWELDHYPLPDPWTADFVLSRLGERPSMLLGPLERTARERGYLLDAALVSG